MRVILDAAGCGKETSPLLCHKPTSLLCVGGKPIIVHILEFLAQMQFKHVDLILHHLPHKIEKELGSGERWGITLTYHLLCDRSCPFQVVRLLVRQQKEGIVVFGLGDALPAISPSFFQHSDETAPLLAFYPDGKWSGWGVFPVHFLEEVPKNLAEEDFPCQLEGSYKSVEVQPFLRTHTPKEMLDSNVKFLVGEHSLSIFPTTARHVEEAVWLSRGTSLHPTARIIPPVFIGVFCQINKDAVIGPNAVIEDYCIIDEASEIVHSVICRQSYVGDNLHIQDCIVDRNLLINTSLGSRVTMLDDFILGESYPRAPFSWIFRLLEKGAGLLLFLFFYPFYFAMHLNHHVRCDMMLKLPASGDSLLWKTFRWETFEPNAGRSSGFLHRFFARLPLLKGIIRGDVHFIGVAPRTPEAVEKLPVDWKKLYLSSKVGIITVSGLEEDDGPSTDTCYTAEAFYATKKSVVFDWLLFFTWLKKKCRKILMG